MNMGKLVLMVKDNISPGNWQLGRIIRLWRENIVELVY